MSLSCTGTRTALCFSECGSSLPSSGAFTELSDVGGLASKVRVVEVTEEAFPKTNDSFCFILTLCF